MKRALMMLLVATFVVATPVSTQMVEAKTKDKTVYIAPNSGTKYHYSKSCRGLKKANSIKSIKLSKAKKQGYTLCGYEK